MTARYRHSITRVATGRTTSLKPEGRQNGGGIGQGSGEVRQRAERNNVDGDGGSRRAWTHTSRNRCVTAHGERCKAAQGGGIAGQERRDAAH